MGLIPLRIASTSFLLLITSSLATAAPALRLTSTVIGPVSIAQGSAGPGQQVEAFNAGDGQLNLAFSSTAAWAVASAQAAQNCSTREGRCIPIRIALQTQSLAAGTHAARITVQDPNAVDAPQQLVVTVQIGGGVPDRINLFVAPNGSIDQEIFSTNAPISTTVTTQSGGNWLSVALDGLGSFRFVLPYRVTARHLPGMAEGTYTGSVSTSSAAFPPDNKSVQVNLRVTSQPILAWSPNNLVFRAAQNSIPVTQFLTLANRGQGTLSITGATVTTASGGDWLAAERVAGTDLLSVRATAGSLAPGTHQGSVRIATNAVNSPLAVPVTLDVVTQSGPVAGFERVVNNATFASGEPVAPGTIAAIFGEQLSYREPAGAASLPLPTELGGARVFINDRPAPVFFSSYGQINFQVPFDTPSGTAIVRVDRDGQRGNTVSLTVAASVPRLLRLRGDFAIAVNSDGTFPIPPRFGIPSRPARKGETLVLYAIGLGATNPPVVSGAASPSDPLARVASSSSRVRFGAGGLGTTAIAETSFAGLVPGFVGLYQINVAVPDDSPAGEVPIQLVLDSAASDIAFITVE
jgi:uncharacterized protein (TIGR03437 family)